MYVQHELSIFDGLILVVLQTPSNLDYNFTSVVRLTVYVEHFILYILVDLCLG